MVTTVVPWEDPDLLLRVVLALYLVDRKFDRLVMESQAEHKAYGAPWWQQVALERVHCEFGQGTDYDYIMSMYTNLQEILLAYIILGPLPSIRMAKMVQQL